MRNAPYAGINEGPDGAAELVKPRHLGRARDAQAKDLSFTEQVLRRERLVVAGGLALLTLLAWLYVLVGAGTGMSVWHMISVSLFRNGWAKRLWMAWRCTLEAGRQAIG